MDTKQKTKFRNSARRAIALLGGASETARLMGVTPQAVGKWGKKGYVPGNRCRAVAKLLNGAMTPHDLNPDVFGPAPK